MKIKGFADIGGLAEDVQIQLIVDKLEEGMVVGIFVDSNEKADRYVRKLAGRAREVGRGPGPVNGVVVVKLEGLKH